MVGFLLTQSEMDLLAVATFFGLEFTGMAAGGWLAGAIYDWFGFYAAAFAAGLAFNLINIIIVGSLVLRLPQALRPMPGAQRLIIR
jgi:hypothetical protein